MVRMARIMMAAGVLGFLCLSSAGAQKGERQSVREEIEALHSEVSCLNEELQALRADMKKVLAELRSIKASVAQPKKKRQPDTTVYDVNIGSSPILGAKDAPVTIVHFCDFQCPFCAREYPKLKQVLKDYGQKVRLVYKHFPLSFHKKAKPAHAAAEFARRSGGSDAFWKMHDTILENRKKIDVADLRGYAESMGLNLGEFDKLMADEKKMDELLKADMAEARKCKVRGTPTILINGLKLASRSLKSYKKRIDAILKAGGKKTRPGPVEKQAKPGTGSGR